MQARKLGHGNPVVPIRPRPLHGPLTARLIEAVKADVERGIYSTPLTDKATYYPDWPNAKLSDSAAIDVAWRKDGVTGRGILLGTISGGLDDVDLDCAEAIQHAGLWLKPTRGWGHDGQITHWLYRRAPGDVATDLKKIVCLDPLDDKSTLLELRRNGCQSMAPPSMHPNGSEVVWNDVPEFTVAPAAETEWAWRQFSAATLLHRFWPKAKQAHDANQALMGMLARHWDAAAVEYFLHNFQAMGGYHSKRLAYYVKHTFDRLKNKDRNITGRTRLIKLLGEEHGPAVVDQVCELLLLAPGAVPAAATDDGLALGFVEERGRNLRHAQLGRGWYAFKDYRFEVDGTNAVTDQVRDYMRPIADANPKQRKRLLSRATISAVSALALTDRRVALRPEQFDANPWVLNTPDGLVDLKTGSIRPTTPEDLVTKATAVGPCVNADCPRWLLFLDQIMDGDQSLIAFLQRKIGYVLTGVVTEEDLTFLCGVGRNGKGVLTNTIYDLLGDYASVAPSELFIAQRSEGHPTALASLQGVRFATASETEAGHQFALAKVKMLTGGDPITARFMRQDFFRYNPTHKLWISSNHKPALPQGGGVALRKRLHLVPFGVVFYSDPTKPDDQLAAGTKVLQRENDLREQLKKEWPGILRWAIDGCRLWLDQGLAPPEVVIAATEEYVADEDQIGRWIDDNCERDRRPETAMRTLTSVLFDNFKNWAVECGERPGNQNDFSKRLVETHGFAKDHERNGNWITGLAVRKTGRGAVAESEEL